MQLYRNLFLVKHLIFLLRVPVLSRNAHQIVFRLVEIGVAVWFPCVLWNCVKPERLWILNPRRILKRDPSDPMLNAQRYQVAESEFLVGEAGNNRPGNTADTSSTQTIDCWICYDGDRKDMGPLIQPCACKGDVSAVHHDCLKQWLMESHTNPENVRCKVCRELYTVKRGQIWFLSGLTIAHWSQTVITIVVMGTTLIGAFTAVRLYHQMTVRTVSVGCAILVEYLCLK